MSGVIDDVTSVFSDIFGSGGGSDVVDAASSAADTASNAAQVASDVAAESDVAGTSATVGDAIGSAGNYLDNAAAASYTAGVSTGDFGQGFNFAADASGNLAPGSSYLGSTVYDTIDNGQFNPNDFGGLDPNAPAYTNMAMATANYGPAAAQANAGSSWWSKTKSFLGIGGDTSGGGGASISSNDSLSRLMMGQMIGNMIGGVVQAGGAYLASKPRPPANFSGRTPGGGGGGLGMHTVNGGFGLAAGGSETPPSGVPSALQPNPQAEALGGSGGLSHVQGPNGAPNLQQNVANQAGVGGLIPQGAVNYMKGGGNG